MEVGHVVEEATKRETFAMLDRTRRDDRIALSSCLPARKLHDGHMDLWNGTNLLPILHRILEEHKVDQLDVTELTQLEHKLDAILRQTKTRKLQLMMKSVTALHEKIAAPMDEATIDDGSRDHLNHWQQMQGSFVDQELYGFSNTNQAAIPLPPFQQQ